MDIRTIINLTKLVIDLADPNNPIAKVRKVEIEFTAIHAAPDAWNINMLVKKLEQELGKNGFIIGKIKPLHYWDGEGREISEDSMRSYLYRKHGHTSGRCSQCPDPVKWAEVEKLRRREFYRNKEVWDDMKQGRPPKGFNWSTGEIANKVVYIYETEEERAIRLNSEKRKRGRPNKIEQPFTLWDDSEADMDKRNYDNDPGLQIEYDRPIKKQGEK